MKKILVLGSTGMAGHLVYLYLKSLRTYEMADISFRNKLHPETILVDVRNEPQLEEIIVKIKPDIIINCLGVLISGSNSAPENAIYINAYLPHRLSQVARLISAKLIHISTDCVFDGKIGGYDEYALTNAPDVYGKSKALGEVINDIDLTVRTSIIGPELKRNGEGLFHWFMSQLSSVNGYKSALWSGVTTLQLAKSISKIIEENYTGLVHIVGNQPITKYELLGLLNNAYDRNLEIVPCSMGIINKSMVSTRDDISFPTPSYVVMIGELKAWMSQHASLYGSIYNHILVDQR